MSELYYEKKSNNRKRKKLISYRNNIFAPARIEAREIAKTFDLPLTIENEIASLLLRNPRLASEIGKNIRLFIEKMSQYGYSQEEAKKMLLVQRYRNILNQSNGQLKARLELLKRNNLEEKALTLFPNLTYDTLHINAKTLEVISECLKAHGLNDDEIGNYYVMHTGMLERSSLELRRTFAILHRRNLLENALFQDSRLLCGKADAALVYAMIESTIAANMLVNVGNLYTYSRSTSMKEKEALKELYPFGLKQKMVVDFFYNDFVSQDKNAQVKERK